MGSAGWIRDGSLHDFIRFGRDFATCVDQLFEFEKLEISHFAGLFQGHLLLISESKLQRLGLPSRGFRKDGIAKNAYHGNRF